MNMKLLDEQIQSIKKELQRLKDIEAVRKLENAYGFYLIHFMNREIIDCFSDRADTTVVFPEGTFFGKEGVERAFGTTNKNMDPEFMHQMMQLSGVIDIETDGKTAKGRWWGFGAMAIPSGEEISMGEKSEGVKQSLACGVYENEFIKEGEVWKIWKFKWVPLYSCIPEHGWVKPERLSKQALETGGTKNPDWWKPDIPSGGKDYAYPSGYILPFHYKHPVTENETSERLRNVSFEENE